MGYTTKQTNDWAGLLKKYQAGTLDNLKNDQAWQLAIGITKAIKKEYYVCTDAKMEGWYDQADRASQSIANNIGEYYAKSYVGPHTIARGEAFELYTLLVAGPDGLKKLIPAVEKVVELLDKQVADRVQFQTEVGMI